MTNYFESVDCFDSQINLSFASIANKTDIIDDTNIASEIIKVDASKIAIPVQEHTDTVRWVSSSGIYKKCDGLASNLRYNIILSLSVADCTPVCFFDPITKNYALVHSGWKGTYKKISINAVKLILSNGSDLENIFVYLGPSISSKNYEVDMDVAKLFSKNNYISKGEKYLLNIKSQISSDIIDMGIKPNNIICSNICTYDDMNLCSYRRDGKNAGRMIFLMGEYDRRN